MGAGGITERQLRDAWARWTELLPGDLDWETHIDVVAGDPATIGGVEHTTFVWEVRLCQRGLFTQTLGTWEVGSAQAALRVLDALTELLRHRDVIDAHLERAAAPFGASDDCMIITSWVWERLR